jgi:hypothetical protein
LTKCEITRILAPVLNINDFKLVFFFSCCNTRTWLCLCFFDSYTYVGMAFDSIILIIGVCGNLFSNSCGNPVIYWLSWEWLRWAQLVMIPTVLPTDISQYRLRFGFSLLYKTVFHLNSLTAQLSYEGRAAVEGAK